MELFHGTIYLLVFLITSWWDIVWRMLTDGSLPLCYDKHILFCPVKWEWVKAGRGFFLDHTIWGGMFVAGVSGIYAFFVMDILRNIFGESLFSYFLLLGFSSWVVGIPMRYAKDPVHNFLFSSLRKHYYEPLGFAWSSFSDTQSGYIVWLTYFLLYKFV